MSDNTNTAKYAAMTVKELQPLVLDRTGTGRGRITKAQMVQLLVEADALDEQAAQDKTDKAAARKASRTAKAVRDAEQAAADLGTAIAQNKAAKNAKAPADAQAATNPSLAKAERFAAAAAEFGWKAEVQQSDTGVTATVVATGNGFEIVSVWVSGVHDYDASGVTKPSATKQIRFLNASAAKKIMAANPVKVAATKTAAKRTPKAARKAA